MDAILLVSILISFVLALVFLPKWRAKCKNIDMLWEDMNKFKHPKNVASSGGIVVIMSFVLGVLFYIFVRKFIFSETDGVVIEIFSLLCVILILSIVGLVDDLLGWKKGGLSIKFRIFLVIVAAIPLMVINAGDHTMNFPVFGNIEFGILYPLLLIPLGIAGASTTFNMLAGMNGLEAGEGIIIISFLSFIAYATGTSWLALVGLCMVAALIVFYFYNKFPASVFPGDTLTYSIGGLIACMAILGNFEKIAVFVFIPYIIETFLKLRGKLKIQSFAVPQKDGSLEMPYEKIYGLTHLSLFILKKFKKKVYERDVVYFIFAFQIALCLVALFLFRNSIFRGIF